MVPLNGRVPLQVSLWWATVPDRSTVAALHLYILKRPKAFLIKLHNSCERHLSTDSLYVEHFCVCMYFHRELQSSGTTSSGVGRETTGLGMLLVLC